MNLHSLRILALLFISAAAALAQTSTADPLAPPHGVESAIGPRPDGTIPDEVRQELLEAGAWLGQNGDAIYGTRLWKICGEGPTRVQAGHGKDKGTRPYTPQDFRFTKKGNNLYAIEMAWPTDGRAVIHALGSTREAKGPKITDVKLLGSQAKLQWHLYEYALEVRLPNKAPGKYAYALQVATSN